jgi:hypothetical protein
MGASRKVELKGIIGSCRDGVAKLQFRLQWFKQIVVDEDNIWIHERLAHNRSLAKVIDESMDAPCQPNVTDQEQDQNSNCESPLGCGVKPS